MSYLTIEAQRDHLLNDKGPFRRLIVDKSATITAGSGEVADGSWDRPFTTIQAAINALPAVGVDTDHDAVGTVIHIIEGVYTENLSFSGEGFVWLTSLGAVSINGTIAYTATGNTNNNNALILTGQFRSSFTISGAITLTDSGSGFDIGLTMFAVNANSTITSPGMVGAMSLDLRRCEIDGDVTLPTATMRFCENMNINGDLTIDGFVERVTDTRFGGNITITSAWATDAHFASCIFSGVNGFSGPAGSLRVDPSSEYWFDLNGWTLGGAATKTHIHSLTKQVEFTTAALAAAASHDENIVLPSGVNDVNIVGIEVTATAGASTEVAATAYTTDAFATIQAPLVGDGGTGFNPSGGPIYGPILSGPVKLSVPLHDNDGTNELHIRVTNITDAGNSTFRVRIKYQIAGAYA
jgi:hypothetical protein